MRPILLLMLISLLNMPGCDLTGGPNHVQKRVEIQVRTYFPNGRAIVSPQGGTILVITCAHGLGKAFLEEIVKSLEKNCGIQQLHEGQLPIKLSPYRFVVLVFDQYIIRWDTDTEQHWIVPSDPQSSILYQAACRKEPGQFPVDRVNQGAH